MSTAWKEVEGLPPWVENLEDLARLHAQVTGRVPHIKTAPEGGLRYYTIPDEDTGDTVIVAQGVDGGPIKECHPPSHKRRVVVPPVECPSTGQFAGSWHRVDAPPEPPRPDQVWTYWTITGKDGSEFEYITDTSGVTFRRVLLAAERLCI